MSIAYPFALDAAYKEIDRLRADNERLRAGKDRAVYIAEHLWQMVPREVWRDHGGDDGQGHYEGDYHAEKVRDELAALRGATDDD